MLAAPNVTVRDAVSRRVCPPGHRTVPACSSRVPQAARTEQNTRSWQAKYRIRAGAESTIRQAVTGTRRARYRGLAKTHLEHVYSAVALNLIRLDAHWNDRPLDRHRTSHLARLEQRLQGT